MLLTLNKKKFDTETENKELLEYLLRFGLVKYNTVEEKELIRKILEKADYFVGDREEVMLLCKKCGNRYRSFTDGALLHRECNSMYYKSDGNVVNVRTDDQDATILLTSPECYGPVDSI
jgi:hypothetical protein